MRWVLLDEVLSIEKGRLARSRGRVPGAEYSPELLIIEMMAQTGALLVGLENEFTKDLVFAKIDTVDFQPGLKPGDPLEIEALPEGLRSEGGWLKAKVASHGRVVAEGRFLLLNVGKLRQDAAEPITFHKSFMDYFQIRNKVR